MAQQNQKEIAPVKAETKDIKRSSNSVYSKLLCNNAIVCCWAEHGQIYKSWSDRYSKHSDNSFCLVPRTTGCKGECNVNILCERFGIIDRGLFEKKYHQAVSGDGQEWKRITTLHSSSLLALLCFYSVSEDHPLEYKNYRFTESLFEVKTPVKGKHKSNMDVVLRGKNILTEKQVTLFLESKFSEYLNSGKYEGINAEVYRETYRELGLLGNQTVIKPLVFKEDGNDITIKSEERGYYCGGIKQMLSHYIGVSHYRNGGAYATTERKSFKWHDDEDVLLGEILYRLPQEIDPTDKFGKYAKTYKKLAEVINSKQNTFRMADEVLAYQDFFGKSEFIMEEIVRKFYSL